MSEVAPVPIYDDPREIAAIYTHLDSIPDYAAGKHGITRIVAYKENGEYAHIPWLAVYRGEEITARVPAHKVAIIYRAEVPHVG